jgi:hypothetical protein
MVPVYDTVLAKKAGREEYSLLLSLDTIPERTVPDSNILYGYGQNYYPYPPKLYYRSHRLYQINIDGSIAKDRVKSFWSKKKVPNWFYKTK